jgi:hypothetical protein
MADLKKKLGALGKVGKRLVETPEQARLRELMSHSGDNVLPLKLPRANLSDEFINAQADRVARQMLGEHVTSGKAGETKNLAGRSMKESERVKNLNYTLKPTGTVAKETPYVPRKGDVKVAFPGDQTVSDKILVDVNGFPIDSHQQGGAYYGLGQKHLPEPEFWKSTETPAKNVQGKVNRLAELYEPERVIGSHLAMGPTSNNFAMHLADANLKAVDWTKVHPDAAKSFDDIISGGYKDPKTGELITFPHWPGLADRQGALAAMKEDSNLRKWFTNRMKTPSVTQPRGLPNGLDIQYAITEPRIRDMEINMTGLMTGKLKPDALVEAAGAPHNTYSHRILGEAYGPEEVLSPFVISFPDAATHIASTKRPSDFTGTIQKVFPHQVVDDQYINQYNQYRERIKKLTGQKKGGAIDISEADKRLAKAIENRMAKGGEVDLEAADARLSAAIEARMGMAGGGKVKGAAKVFKKLFDDAPVESQAAKQARLNMMPTARIGLEAPGILIPSKMNNVREAVRNIKGNYGARRVERAADEIPNLERMYQEDALKEAFTGDNASAMITLSPAEFEKYASELSKRTSVGPKMAELAKQGDIDKMTVPTDEYIKHLQRLQGGFDDVPYLNLFKDEVGLPTSPKIIGHEGRHRSRALAESGAPSSLVKINPRGDLREGMPRRTQEEFIEALKEELELSNRLVVPESEPYFRRPDVKFPDVYAKGGDVHMGKGGKMAALGKLGKRLLADPDAVTPSVSGGTRKFGNDANGLNIIKETGGNWTPSGDLVYQSNLDRELNNLKKGRFDTPINVIRHNLEQDALAGNTARKAQLEQALERALKTEAANKWVDSNLRNYVTKQMATEGDPVRKLAEEGIKAFPVNIDEFGDAELRTYGSAKAKSNRKTTGYVPEGVAKSPLAKHYETMTDESISPVEAKHFQRIQALPKIQRPAGSTDMPWVDKLDPETPIFSLSRDADFNKFGFDHIMDVLREDLAAGRIRPEQMNKISMEQAVRRTHEYDEALKAKMLNARIAEQANANVFKEYPEGYKWVQLDKPGQFALESDIMGHSVRGYEPPKGHPDYTDISGDSGYGDYGHGGYEAIKSGDAKIYSLRDPKGMSHVTVEVGRSPLRTWDDVTKAVGKEKAAALHKEFYDIGADRTDNTEAAMAMFLKNKGVQPSERITQVKGKQNAAPNEEYLQFVQDFVKGGDWSEVGDISNTGLRDVKFMTNPDVYQKYLERGLKVPKYATEKELDELHNEYLRLAEPRNYKPPEGMAEGGGAFKKLQFMGGGGITTTAGTFSPEELGINPSDLPPDVKFADVARYAKRIGRNAADLSVEGKEQLEKEYRQLAGKGAKKDALIRVGSQILGGGVDTINFGLGLIDDLQSVIPAISKPESVMDVAGTGNRVPKFKLATDEPTFGSEHFLRKFKEAKLLGENEFPLTEFAANLFGPAAAVGVLNKGKQAYKGAKTLVNTPKKRRGGLTAMAR